MNIKGFGINNVLPLENRSKADSKDKIRSEASTDRDADGRRQRDDQEQPEEPLTEEQVQQAIEYLKAHPGVKDNHLTVKRIQANGQVVLVIEDHLGKVVRRIPQSQIHFLAQSKDDVSSKGRLYDKAT
jgi:uncharacterized FlaG/YvyC family protein